MPRAGENDLDYIFNRLNDAKEIVYDAETNGLSWRDNFICGHVITFSPNPSDSWYLPIAHKEGNNLDKHKINKELIKRINKQDLTIIGHNLAFDLKFLSVIGHDLSAKYQDTSINAPLLNELQPKFSLEYCANMAGVEAKKKTEIDQHIRNKFPHIKDEPMAHFWELSADDSMSTIYAAGDGTSTWQLRDWQQIRLEREELLKVWSIENRLIPVLVRMTLKGIKVDEEYLNKLYAYIKNKITVMQQEFPLGFNSKSPIDMEKYCREHGVTNWPLTPGKRPSFPENFLETFEAGLKIVQVRKLLTLNSMFIEPLLNTHLANGRVHPNFNQMRGDGFGAITGRLSSERPSFQQIPKRDKFLGPMIRAAFIADEGMEFADPDMAQAEPRLLGEYSRAKALLDEYKTNPDADAHQVVADWASISRDWAKHANMTIINSGGRNVLVKKYHVPEDKVDGLLDQYFKAMPEVKEFQKKAAQKFKERGWVKTLLGRKIHLPSFDKAYTAVNRLLQGGNADIIKLKLVEMDDYLASEGRPVDILNTVHDSTSFQYHVENKQYYCNCLQIWESFGEGDLIKLDVPMRVDDSCGENWAIATYGEEVRDKINEIKNFDMNNAVSIYDNLE